MGMFDALVAKLPFENEPLDIVSKATTVAR